MDAAHWQRLSPLLDALLEQAPRARAEHLATLRNDDPALANELERLLRLEEGSDDVLSQPIIAALAGLHGGSIVGPYQLKRLLGQGGMGQVWLAQRNDGLHQHQVALKLLRPGLADPNLRLRFTRERQILARLEHPNIAGLLDAGISSDGQPYLALEYVEGAPLTDWCRTHAITVDARLRLFQQICRALSHAHANLIVHRDLKPSNILVTAQGEVRLLDFGIAKLIDSPDGASEFTRTGARVFTLHYAAPEQLRGEPVTTMTDVYALGMVLFELLADARPYQLKRQSDAEWEDAILHADPQRASQVLQRAADTASDRDTARALRRRARLVSGDLDNIVLKALAKRPEDRYASVEALGQDVQRYRHGRPVLARRQRLTYRIRKYISRHRWRLASSALIVLVLSSAILMITWQARSAMRQANRAQTMQNFVIGLVEQAGSTSTTGQINLHALLKNGRQQVDRELAQQPEARAELYGVIADLHLSMGNYREALSLLQKQADLIKQQTDPPPALVLDAVADMGRVRHLLGDPQACIQAMRDQTELALRQQRQVPLSSSEYYSQLGRCQLAVGQVDAARVLIQRSLDLRRTVPGAETLVIENLADLGQLTAATGDSASALRQYERALQQLRKHAGTRHPFAIELERNLCSLERTQGRATRAEQYCRNALAIGMAVHGPNHRDTLDARRQLAALHVDQGHYAAAEAEFRQTRKWLIDRLGPDHLSVARDDNSLAITLWERGYTEQALPLLDHALATLRNAQRPSNLSDVMFNKAMVLHASGASRQALVLLIETRRIRVSELGTSHPLIGDTDRLLGEVHAALGDTASAGNALRSAARLTLAGYGPEHSHTQRAQLSLARFRANTDRADATPAMRELDALARLPGNDVEYAKLRWRARAYAAQARCRMPASSAAARSSLRKLVDELAVSMPEGGELVREVNAIRAACSSPATLSPVAAVPATDRSGSHRARSA